MRYKCKIAYDGTAFSGYQIQPNKRTVQLELETALTRLHKGKAVKVTGSGRTDAGVHAKGQVIHFESPLNIPVDRWRVALNAQLPPDVVVVEATAVSDEFHARFDAKGKEYRYFVNTSQTSDPFTRNHAYHFPFLLDVEKMKEAAQYLVGTHDFTSFCSAKTEVVDRVRTIEKIDIFEGAGTIEFRFRGNGFLYNMVRILVGTLLQVGNGDIAVEEVPAILAAKDRTKAGKTAPGHGLFLWEVFY